MLHTRKELVCEDAGQNHPGELPAPAQRFQRLRILHRADHQKVAFLARAVLNALHEGAEKRVAHRAADVLRRHMRDHTDDVRLILDQRARRHARDVMLPVDDLPDLLYKFR